MATNYQQWNADYLQASTTKNGMLNHLNARRMTSLLMPVLISWFIHIYDDKGSGRVAEHKIIKPNEIPTLQGPGHSFKVTVSYLKALSYLHSLFQ
jgi:hypothetical protein